MGYFIELVSKDYIPQHLLDKLRHPSISYEIKSVFFRLYSMIDSSDNEVYTVALNLLGKLPNSFQVFACTHITTQEAVTLFFERVNNYHHFRYIVIDINILSLDIQEVCFVDLFLIYSHHIVVTVINVSVDSH